MQFRRMAGVALPVAQGEAVGSDQYFMDKRQSANLFANLERGRIEGGENSCLLRDGESPDMTALHPEIFRSGGRAWRAIYLMAVSGIFRSLCPQPLKAGAL